MTHQLWRCYVLLVEDAYTLCQVAKMELFKFHFFNHLQRNPCCGPSLSV